MIKWLINLSQFTHAKGRLSSIYLPALQPFFYITDCPQSSTVCPHETKPQKGHISPNTFCRINFIIFFLTLSLYRKYLGLILRSAQACTQEKQQRFQWDYFCFTSAQVPAQTGPLSVLSLPGFPSYWWVSTESQLSLILPEHGSVSKTQNSKVCCTAKQETQIKEFQTAVYHKPVKTMYIVQIVIGETDQVTEPI